VLPGSYTIDVAAAGVTLTEAEAFVVSVAPPRRAFPKMENLDPDLQPGGPDERRPGGELLGRQDERHGQRDVDSVAGEPGDDPERASQRDVSLTGVTDAIVAGDTQLTVTVQPGSYTIGTGSAAVTLVEADAFVVSVAVAPAGVTEDGGNSTVTFSRAGPTNGDLAVSFATAKSGTGNATYGLSGTSR